MNTHTHTDVGTSAFRANLEALRAAQKPSAGTPAYSRYVNRPLGRLVAAYAHSFGLTPNQATAISASMTGLAIVLLATVRPGWELAVAVPTLLAAGYVMDSVDGQLARLRRRSTTSGEWLDHSVDCCKTVCLHLGVLISWYQYRPVDAEAGLLIPIGFQIVDVLSFFGLILMPLLRKVYAGTAPAAPPPKPGREHPLRPWLLLPADYGAVVWMFALLAWPMLFLSAYTAMFAVNVVLLALAGRKWWRELRAIDGLR